MRRTLKLLLSSFLFFFILSVFVLSSFIRFFVLFLFFFLFAYVAKRHISMDNVNANNKPEVASLLSDDLSYGLLICHVSI